MPVVDYLTSEELCLFAIQELRYFGCGPTSPIIRYRLDEPLPRGYMAHPSKVDDAK